MHVPQKVFMIFTALFMLVPARTESLQTQPIPEYQIKAVFLYNFAQFVEWPSSTLPESESPLVIGILGNDPFGKYLDETVRGENVNGHPLVVQRFPTLDKVSDCHILFVNYLKGDDIKPVFEKMKAKNVLTVSDRPNFIQQGGMVRLFTDKNKTKIQINHELAKNADLTISSKLLRLAEIVNVEQN
jgi:hypothetical protein